MAIGAYKTFRESEDIVDLEMAIRLLRDAISLANRSDLSWLTNLGIFLLRRFEKIGKKVDLDEAITMAHIVLESTPPDNPSYPAYLSTLGVYLRKRFEQTRKTADLDEAIAKSKAGGRI